VGWPEIDSGLYVHAQSQVFLRRNNRLQGDQIPVKRYLVLRRVKGIDTDAKNQKLQKHPESCCTKSNVVRFRSFRLLLSVKFR
jgi:hypothetical protein